MKSMLHALVAMLCAGMVAAQTSEEPHYGLLPGARSDKLSVRDGDSGFSVRMCPTFTAPDGGVSNTNCANFNVPNDALTAGFEIDTKAVTDLLKGDSVSSIQVNQGGIVCGYGSQINYKVEGFLFNAVSIGHCEGTRMIQTNADGQQDLPDGLNDNLKCICCFASPSD